MDLKTTAPSVADNDEDIIDLTDIIEKGTVHRAQEPESIDKLMGDLGNVESPDFENIVAATNADLDALLEDMEEEIAQKAAPDVSAMSASADVGDVAAPAFLSDIAPTMDTVSDSAVDVESEDSFDMPDMRDVDALLASIDVPPQPEQGADSTVDDDIAGDIDSLFADILNGGGVTSEDAEPILEQTPKPAPTSAQTAAPKPAPSASNTTADDVDDFDLGDLEDLLNTVDADTPLPEKKAEAPLSEKALTDIVSDGHDSADMVSMDEVNSLLSEIDDMLDDPSEKPAVSTQKPSVQKNTEPKVPPPNTTKKDAPAASAPELDLSDLDDIFNDIEPVSEEPISEEPISEEPVSAVSTPKASATDTPSEDISALDMAALDDIFGDIPEEPAPKSVTIDKKPTDAAVSQSKISEQAEPKQAEPKQAEPKQAEFDLDNLDIDAFLDGTHDFPIDDMADMLENAQEKVASPEPLIEEIPQEISQETLLDAAFVPGTHQAVSMARHDTQQSVAQEKALPNPMAEDIIDLTTRLRNVETQQQLFEVTQQQLLSRMSTQDVHQRERISALEARLASVYAEEQASIHARVAHVEEKIVNPEIDFSSVQESLEKRLDLLEERFSAFEERMAQNVEQTIVKLEERFIALEERILHNEEQTVAKFEARFSALEERIAQNEKQVVVQFEERFTTLEERMVQSEQQTVVQLEERFSELEERMAQNLEQAATKAAAQIIREEITALLSVVDDS